MSDLMLARREAGELLAAAAHRAIEELREPEERAALAGAFLLPLIVLSRYRRLPPLPVVMLLGLIGDQAGRVIYRASADIRTIAEAARAQMPEG